MRDKMQPDMFSRLKNFVSHAFFVGCTSLFSVVFFFTIAPSQAFAAGRLGSHLGHFDLSAQISALQMIKGKAAEPNGYPITMNVGIDTSPEDIQRLADAASGFAVMVRITGITGQTTAAQVRGLADRLNAVNWSVAGKPIVILGNELNNLEVEWQDSTMNLREAGVYYARELFPSLAGLNRTKYDVSAATVDPYNQRFDYKEFLSGAMPAYSNGQVFAANIYNDSSAEGSSKIAEVRGVIQNPAGRTVLTEYGPGNPQSPLEVYQKFYQSNPVPDPAEMATALIPSNCGTGDSGFGKYFLIDNKFYDIQGNEIDPKDCSAAATYDDESKNVDEEVSGIYVYKDIFADMQKFGYTTDQAREAGESRAARYIMMCAPRFWIGAQVDGDNRDVYLNGIEGFTQTLANYCAGEGSRGPLGTNAPNCLFDPVTANFTVLNQNISAPLYRRTSFNAEGQQKDSNRAESFETFFGLTTKKGRETGDFVLQAPDKRLLSEQQYCAQTVNYLKAIDVLCKEPEAFTQDLSKEVPKPGRCALDNEFRDSAGNQKRYIDVLRQVQSESASHGITDAREYCFLPPEEQDPQLKKDLSQVQPMTRNAFKIGYLIYYNTGRYKRSNKPLNEQEDYDAFWKQPDGSFSKYFHPVYRTFEELFSRITFDVVPFLVPANVFSRAGHEEILVNPSGGATGEDYRGKQDGVFSSSYYQIYSSLVPDWKVKELQAKEDARRSAVANGMELAYKNKAESWNTVNDTTNQKPYVYCPVCDPFDQYTFKQVVPVDKATRDMLPFAKVIWNRINAGIYAKEFTEKLQTEGYAEVKDDNLDEATRGSSEDNQVAIPPDAFSFCDVAPELVRGETAITLNAKGSVSAPGQDGKESLWGKVEDSVTNITSIVRDPSFDREDKYRYDVKGFLLLPQEYGLLMQSELDFMRLLTSEDQQNKILVEEQKQNNFGADLGVSPLDPNYDEEVPKYNRFLRMNGQVFNLEDLTLATSGRHGKDGDPGWYYTESLGDYQARIKNDPNCGPDKPPCERKHIEITSKLNSWDPGYNEGKADYRPIVPGGWLARGVFELMAHVLAPIGSANYQETYCGLEDYWLGGNCRGILGGLAEGGVASNISCMNIWVDQEVAQQHAADIKSNLQSRVDWYAFYGGGNGGFLDGLNANPVPRCSNGVSPDPSLYDTKATQWLFEALPECGGQLCYEWVVDQTLARSVGDGKVVDPYISIAIALNENGGFITSRKDRMGRHFGAITHTGEYECTGDVVDLDTIPNKFGAMIRTLIGGYNGESTLGQSGVAILTRYAGNSGYNSTIANLVSNFIASGGYTPQCQQ